MTTPTELAEAEDLVPIELELPGTGRPAMLAVPPRMTDSEWLGLVGMLPRIRDKLRAAEIQAPPTPALVGPGGRRIS